MLRVLLAVVAVFVVWSGIDALVQGVLLSLTYEETKALWRPMEEFKQGLMYLVTGVTAPAWLVGTVVEGAAAGLLVGLIVREAKPKVAGA